MLEVLLEQGVSTNSRNDAGETALIAAVSSNQQGIAELLLSRGANVDAVVDGHSALWYALHNKLGPLVDLLLENGAIMDGEIACRRWPALIKAARLNRGDYAEHLMLKGAEIDAKDDHGHTALWHARLMDSDEVINLLLEWGADIYVMDHIPRVYWTSRYRQHRSTYQRHQDHIELADKSSHPSITMRSQLGIAIGTLLQR